MGTFGQLQDIEVSITQVVANFANVERGKTPLERGFRRLLSYPAERAEAPVPTDGTENSKTKAGLP